MVVGGRRIVASGWGRLPDSMPIVSTREPLRGRVVMGVRPLRLVLLVVLLVAVGLVGFWAGRVALEPPEDPLAVDSGPVTYVVESGEVGRSLSFSAVAEWGLVPVGRNGAAGVVTSVDVDAGEVVEPGDVLYTVGLRPVVVAVGSVPMFRDLARGASGDDVVQLQGLLAGLGFYSGELTGTLNAATESAVRAWQDSLGLDDTGVVAAGDVVFVPELPAPLVFSDELRVGARLGGGEELVLRVPNEPVFRVPLSIDQRDLVPLSAPVRVRYSEGVWEGRIEQAVELPERGQLDLILAGSDGGAVCGEECARWVSVTRPTDFGVEIVVIPRVEGPVVPVAAIISDPGNRTFVLTDAGEEIDVEVVASAGGIAVVDGVEVGTVIQIPFDDEAG